MPISRIAFVLALAMLSPLAGCATTSTLPGGATDVLAGLRGGLISGEIGQGLSKAARQRVLVAEFNALESGLSAPPVTWSDAASGLSGEVSAGTPYRVGSQDCRPYVLTVMRAGSPSRSVGAACRDDAGLWVRAA